MANTYKKRAEKKLQLYIAACYLFDIGKSYPQVINILSEHELDDTIVASVVDKAMHEEWDKLFEEAKALFAQGYAYTDVVNIISAKEPDVNIVEWICSKWYELKSHYMDCVIEGATNTTEGLKWVVICALVILFLFWAESSWAAKILWSILLVASFLQWFVGVKQKTLSNRLKHFFEHSEVSTIKGL